ncbi:MAG: 5-(carboxyamino)imidazole ribonucleotide mutase [Armatimonadota bacterium]
MGDGAPLVGIVMGSESDLEVMRPCAELLDELGVAHETRVMSAHRTPDLVAQWASKAAERGLKVIIAGAGAAAALPGCVAAQTMLPVIGVPIDATPLSGVDALHSMVQMPSGVPVATVSIDGATNAAVLAARILAIDDPELTRRLEEMTAARRAAVIESDRRVHREAP